MDSSKISDIQINSYFQNIIDIIPSPKESFFPEKTDKSEIFPVYKKIIKNHAPEKDYISMLSFITQKIYKLTFQITNTLISNESKIIYVINKKPLRAHFVTCVNSAKRNLNLFILKKLFQYYPFFCRMLFFYDHFGGEKFEKLCEKDFEFGSSRPTKFLGDENISVLKKKEIENNDFFELLSIFENKIIHCEIKNEEIKDKKFNPLIKEDIETKDYNFVVKKPIQILKEVFLIKLNKILCQSILINGKKIKINGKLKNSNFSYKFTLYCSDKDFAINYIALILIKKFIPKLYEKIFTYYKTLNDYNDYEILENEKEKIFWKILEKSENIKGTISSIEVNGNIKELKNLLLENKFLEIKKMNFLDKENFFFGNKSNFDLLHSFFKTKGFKFKWIIENDGCSYFFENIRNNISIKIGIDSKNILEIFKISEDKLVELLFSSEIFENFTKNFILKINSKNNNQKNYEEFFSQFNCEIIEKKIPNVKFINSQKKIYDLEDFHPEENDLQKILLEIGEIYNKEINFEINEFEEKQQEIWIFIDDDKENGFFFRNFCENKDFSINFSILKFLEMEFKELFDWILKIKYI